MRRESSLKQSLPNRRRQELKAGVRRAKNIVSTGAGVNQQPKPGRQFVQSRHCGQGPWLTQTTTIGGSKRKRVSRPGFQIRSLELPERATSIGTLSDYTLIPDLKSWRRLQRALEQRLYKDPVVTARRKDVYELAGIPSLLSCARSPRTAQPLRSYRAGETDQKLPRRRHQEVHAVLSPFASSHCARNSPDDSELAKILALFESSCNAAPEYATGWGQGRAALGPRPYRRRREPLLPPSLPLRQREHQQRSGQSPVAGQALPPRRANDHIDPPPSAARWRRCVLAKITPVNEGVGGGVGGPPLRDHPLAGPPLPVTLRLIPPRLS